MLIRKYKIDNKKTKNAKQLYIMFARQDFVNV